MARSTSFPRLHSHRIYVTISLFILPHGGTSAVPCPGYVSTAVTLECRHPYDVVIQSPWVFSEEWPRGYMVVLYFTSGGTSVSLSTMAALISLPPRAGQHLPLSWWEPSSSWEVLAHCGFDWHVPERRAVEHPSVDPLAIVVSSLNTHLSRFLSIFNLAICFSAVQLCEFLSMFWC